jgi:hypothetical protein
VKHDIILTFCGNFHNMCEYRQKALCGQMKFSRYYAPRPFFILLEFTALFFVVSRVHARARGGNFCILQREYCCSAALSAPRRTPHISFIV